MRVHGDVEVSPLADGPEECFGGAASGSSTNSSLHHHETSLKLSIDVPVVVKIKVRYFRLSSNQIFLIFCRSSNPNKIDKKQETELF